MTPTLKFVFVRIAARLIDYLVWGMIFVVLLGESLNQLQNFFLYFYLLFWLYPFFEAFFIFCFKTTFGKKLFGIFIVDENEKNLSYLQALKRSFLVFGAGFGFFTPVISLILPFYGLYRIASNKPVFWDIKSNAKIIYQKPCFLDKLVLVLFVSFLVMGWLSTAKQVLKPRQMNFSLIQNSVLDPYNEMIRPKMLAALSLEAVLTPENAKKSLQTLKDVKDLIQIQRISFFLLRNEVQEQINKTSNHEVRLSRQRQLDDISKQTEDFLFAESLRVDLFENILSFFEKAEENQILLEEGNLSFKDKETEQQYNAYLFQLQAFLTME